MKGNYYSQISQCAKAVDLKNKLCHIALQAYEDAFQIANNEMKGNDPLRLGLALNYSIFYHDVYMILAKHII